MQRMLRIAGFWLCLCGLSTQLMAQWVWFREESSTRLVLSSVAVNDDEEKDIGIGDFNKDGWIDVIVVRKEPFSTPGARADVLLMNEKGTLTDRTMSLAPQFISNPTDSRDVLVADLDGDTWLDLLLANTFTDQPVYYRNRGEDGKGNWLGFVDESQTRIPDIFPVNQAMGPQFCAVWSGDLTGDGSPELYFSNYEGAGGTTDALLVNNGSGVFTDETTARLGNLANVAFGTSVEFHDVDNDGDLDILKMSTLYDTPPFDPRGIFVLFNNGSGDFTQFPTARFPAVDPYMFTGAFLNQDAFLDFYVVNDSGDQLVSITAVMPNGPLTLASTKINAPRTTGFGGNVKLADLDGDGDLDVGLAPIDVDIANCGLGDPQFALMRNNGSAVFTEPWGTNENQNFHIDPHDFAFLDINRDGREDMFMGLCTGWAVFVQGVGPRCPGDCFPKNGDGMVDMNDLREAMVAWGQGPAACDVMPNDGNGGLGDGQVDISDLIAVLGFFGPCTN